MRPWIAALAIALSLTSAPPAWALHGVAADLGTDLVSIGRRIYREGKLPTGQLIVGVAQAGVQRVGADAACVTCHRRSGYGSSEGSIEIRSITGPALFGEREARPVAARPEADAVRPTSLHPDTSPAPDAEKSRQFRIAAFYGARQRPPYDEAGLRRAIREGIDVYGRSMNPGMPRYALDDDALAALSAYLATLSAQSSPGVTDDAIHFATVVQPGVPPAMRQAVIDMVQAYIDDRNAGMRSERRREQAGSIRLGRTYREWVLHVWNLSGPSGDWERQLEALYARQPVFALVSGIGAENWRPIHEFSERYEVPCILPETGLPVSDGSGHYTVYFSRGIVLEAEVLAKYLQQHRPRGPLVQVYRRDEFGLAAAEAFRKAWMAATGDEPQERVLPGAAGPAFWRELAAETPNATLAIWLRPPDLADAHALADAELSAEAIYLPSSLRDGVRAGLLGETGGRVRLIAPMDLSAAREQQIRPLKQWLLKHGIALIDAAVQMKVFLSLTTVGGVMSHSMDVFSREFLLERIEHRMGNAFELSPYPHLSLGPGQRFASKGAYILGDPATGAQMQTVSDWIVP